MLKGSLERVSLFVIADFTSGGTRTQRENWLTHISKLTVK